jgi:hypothetical protein
MMEREIILENLSVAEDVKKKKLTNKPKK